MSARVFLELLDRSVSYTFERDFIPNGYISRELFPYIPAIVNQDVSFSFKIGKFVSIPKYFMADFLPSSD